MPNEEMASITALMGFLQPSDPDAVFDHIKSLEFGDPCMEEGKGTEWVEFIRELRNDVLVVLDDESS